MQKIDAESFLLLNESVLIYLIPELGPRLKFLNKLANYVKCQVCLFIKEV